MASIDVGIHPDPKRVRVRHYSGDKSGGRFSTLNLVMDQGIVSIFIGPKREVLDALQAALDEIRADMGRAEQAAMAAKRAARADEIRAGLAQTASDQTPTVMADWPAGPPGEALGVFGR